MKVTREQFAKWLGFSVDAVNLAIEITEMSDPDGAYTHLEDMGEFAASEAVEAIYFEYGSLKDAIRAFKEDNGYDMFESTKTVKVTMGELRRMVRNSLNEEVNRGGSEDDYEVRWRDVGDLTKSIFKNITNKIKGPKKPKDGEVKIKARSMNSQGFQDAFQSYKKGERPYSSKGKGGKQTFDVSRVNFSGEKFVLNGFKAPAHSNFSYANFSGGEFNDCVFVDCVFDYSIFSGAKFKNCTFKRCNLNYSKLNDANFENCNFGLSYAEKSNLSNSTFNQCEMVHIHLDNSNLENTKFVKCSLAAFSTYDANLNNTDFTSSRYLDFYGNFDDFKKSNIDLTKLAKDSPRLSGYGRNKYLK